MIKLGAKELRTTKSSPEENLKLKKNPIYIICDNILDTYNTGSIFRLADAVAAEKVFLCGITETPPNTRIKKASINTTEWVAWEYAQSTVEVIEKLRQQFSTSPDTIRNLAPLEQYSSSEPKANREASNIKIVAIEQNEKSVPFDKAKYSFPIAFVVGNETTGISEDVLKMCDEIVELPMFGVNKSLNVMVSLGIILYEAIKGLK